MIVIGVVATS